jgi:phenylpropionate dioxygenase-like ring-hydroxylating dioxygenase large terminal subunit
VSVDEEGVRTARSPGSSYQEIIGADRQPGTDVLRHEHPGRFGDQDIDVARYTSRAFHELEKEWLWSRVWQMACRVEEIPEVGDTILYEICDKSILVVRSGPDEIRAFWNSCRHRGRQLVSEPGYLTQLRCPFHGFTWNLDGSLAFVPSRWDFPQIDDDRLGLGQLRVGVWAGFVFVNPDPTGEDLQSFLGDLADHFADWTLEDRYIEGHAAKIYRANWKVAQEAFMEALHVASTHPQMLLRMGDVNGQYDCYEHFSRSMNASGVPSPIMRRKPSEQEMLDAMLDRRLDEPAQVEVPDGMTFREFSGQLSRESLRPVIGDRADQLSDAELIDSIDYSVFPNFHPWAAYQRLVYRFRPNGDDHESCIMDVYILSPYSGERPAAAPVQELGPDESWIDAEVLGSTGRILDQDSFNIPKVQIGLRSAPASGLPLSLYQESKIRHFHQLLDRWLGIETAPA